MFEMCDMCREEMMKDLGASQKDESSLTLPALFSRGQWSELVGTETGSVTD